MFILKSLMNEIQQSLQLQYHELGGVFDGQAVHQKPMAAKVNNKTPSLG
jgi:hypothetical protein